MNSGLEDRAKAFFVGLVFLTVAASAIISTGFRKPYNIQVTGKVVEETSVYGDVVRGYSTERRGIKGLLEKGINGIIRPGTDKKLYSLKTISVEYDQERWWSTEHHIVDPWQRDLPDSLVDSLGLLGQVKAHGFYLQTEGDVADVNDDFSGNVEGLGRMSKAFAGRGIQFVKYDENGNEVITNLSLVFKKPRGIQFSKPKEE